MCIHAIVNESEKNTFDWFRLLMASIGFYCTVRGTYIVNDPMVGARDMLDRMFLCKLDSFKCKDNAFKNFKRSNVIKKRSYAEN
jgi:DNA helicase TIP49 (TBP-interacting protein)